MRVVLTDVHWLDEQHELSLVELAELSGLSESELRELADVGAVVPINPNATPLRFRAECIATVKTAARLRDDFELNMQGVALALSLLDRIHDLETQLRDLHARLPQRIL